MQCDSQRGAQSCGCWTGLASRSGGRLRRQERGVVLILAIFAAVLLSVLAVAMSSAVRVELRAARAGLERMQGLFLAEAGIRQARAILLYDDQKLDWLQDPWGPENPEPLDRPREFGNGFLRVHVEDACGRINLNTADPETLFRLTGDSNIALAILAWRQSRTPFADDEGALPAPLEGSQVPFQSVGELLLVPGVTPDMFFGDSQRPGLAELVTVESISANTDASGNPRIGLNEFRSWGEFQAFQAMVMARLGAVLTMYDAEQIFNGWSTLVLNGQPGYTSMAQLVTVAGLDYEKVAKLADYFTVKPGIAVHGLVNVNTARPQVIAALPGGSLALGVAVEDRRRQAPFSSLGEFAEFVLDQPDGPEAFTRMIDQVNVKSSSFIIESMGYPLTERGFRTLRALVRRWDDQVLLVHQAEQDWPLPPFVETSVADAPEGRRMASIAGFARQH